jgi:hypothetical protein
MPLNKLSPVPMARVFTVESTTALLRKEMAAHNLRVVGIALLTLVVSLGLWIVLYVGCAWVWLLATTALLGHAQVNLSMSYTILFLVAAGCAVACAWFDQRLTPNALPRDNKAPWEVASDIVLVLPRMTLSIWGTLRAMLRLTSAELGEAAAFLHRLAAERRIPLHHVPQNAANPERRFRILLALQLMEVIEVHRDRDAQETIIRLNTARPDNLGLPRR